MAVFCTKNTTFVDPFFSRNSKWRIYLQNFWDADFFLNKCMSIFISFYRLSIVKKNKTNVAKQEISKCRPNSRWTSKRFYRFKLVYLFIF
jgi:hypothetical protein